MSRFRDALGTIVLATTLFLLVMGISQPAGARGGGIDLDVTCVTGGATGDTDELVVTSTFTNKRDGTEMAPEVCVQRITVEQRVPGTRRNGKMMWVPFTTGVPVDGVATFHLCDPALSISTEATAVRAVGEFAVRMSGTCDPTDPDRATRPFVTRCVDASNGQVGVEIAPTFCEDAGGNNF